MSTRDSIVAFIKWEARVRYADNPDIAGAFERLASLVEGQHDRDPRGPREVISPGQWEEPSNVGPRPS